MSFVPSAKRRQHALLLSSAAMLPLICISEFASAQTLAELPAITVTQSRLFDRVKPAPESATPRVVRQPAPRRTVAPPRPAPTPAPVVNTVAVPADIGIVGASTSVITAEQIARSPGATLQDVIAEIPGVQMRSLFGGVNGTNTTVDLRGFGATGSSNTLVLINGRRLNDLDLAGVDLSTIPRDSVARIEVTRGNSGAVLYGDNAVGGVINIVTKTGAGAPNTARAEVGVGSFNQRMAAISSTINAGPWSTSVFGNIVRSDGYRQNNALFQKNAVGDLRYSTPDFSAFVSISGDDQRTGLPGARTVDPSIGLNQLTDRRGAATPFDFAEKQGASFTTGFTKSLWNDIDLIVDGGVRDKKQQAQFLGTVPLSPFSASAVDSELLTWSITPRLSIATPFFGLRSKILTGIDYYDATYESLRGQTLGAAPIHTYNLSQQSVAGYWQQTIGFLPTTDFSYGGRIQRTSLTARDRVDPLAPGNFFGNAQALPLNTDETNYAYHVGLEHRLTNELAVFGRAASAFRTPNVDERVSSGPSFDPITFAPISGNFTLKTQTSRDVEGGLRFNFGLLQAQTSVYTMDLKNELQFDPVNFFNRNLEPTRRTGSETSASVRATDDLVFRGGVAYTRAVFREGSFAGNDVPLVSRFTANAGVSYNIWQKYVVLDATLRYWSSRRLDNDQGNTQGLIPGNATVDLKLSGQYQQFYWSAGVFNLLDVKYYDYAIASTFTPGRFAAYPLPGRNFLVKAGMQF